MSDKLRELVKKWRAVAEKQRRMATPADELQYDEGHARMEGMAERTEYMADELEALLPTEPVADVAVDNDGWIAFADRWPPKSPALDDPSVETRDTVLVTNSINARDRMGRMSHVWLGMPQQQDGEIMCFEGSSYRTVHGLTHWKPINYTTPTEPAPDREDGDSWERLSRLSTLLPGPYYMDPPDGGGVSVMEQLRRMAEDAARYRWLRNSYDPSVHDDDGGSFFDLAGAELDWTIDENIDAARQEQA